MLFPPQLLVIGPLLEDTTPSTELVEHVNVSLSIQRTTVPVEVNLHHEILKQKILSYAHLNHNASFAV